MGSKVTTSETPVEELPPKAANQEVEAAGQRHEEEDGRQEEVEKAKKLALEHRPDIDFMRVAITWEILLFHVVIVYTPIPYYLHPPGGTWTQPGWEWAMGYVLFADSWHMMYFFFLSGVSSYFSLFKRTEQQFRDERVHRLLVPTLFLMAVTCLPFLALYLAPLDSECGAYYVGNRTEVACMQGR